MTTEGKRVHIGWHWFALQLLLHPLPETGRASPRAPSGPWGAGSPARDPDVETARQAHWVAALAIGCIRAGGDESVESGAAGRDVAQVLDLASRDATILRLAMRFVEEQATLEQPIRARTRTLLLLSLARVQDPDAPS